MIERRPLSAGSAVDCLAYARSASSANNSTPSISNSRWYCFTRAFFGSVRMRLSEASSRSSSVATTASRPMNSGISPNFKRSSGRTSRKISPCSTILGRQTSAPKPIEPGRLRAEIDFLEAL